MKRAILCSILCSMGALFLSIASVESLAFADSNSDSEFGAQSDMYEATAGQPIYPGIYSYGGSSRDCVETYTRVLLTGFPTYWNGEYGDEPYAPALAAQLDAIQKEIESLARSYAELICGQTANFGVDPSGSVALPGGDYAGFMELAIQLWVDFEEEARRLAQVAFEAH